ncbi:MAG: hypothetical protein R3F34_17340 [Planctomycetota bacterium]
MAAVISATLFPTFAPDGDPNQTEFSCNDSTTWVERGSYRSYVSDAYAASQQTTADDLAFHAWVWEQLLDDDLECRREQCGDTWPEWQCSPYADVVVNAAIGTPHPTLPGYVYSITNAVITRGCTPCFN